MLKLSHSSVEQQALWVSLVDMLYAAVHSAWLIASFFSPDLSILYVLCIRVRSVYVALHSKVDNPVRSLADVQQTLEESCEGNRLFLATLDTPQVRQTHTHTHTHTHECTCIQLSCTSAWICVGQVLLHEKRKARLWENKPKSLRCP